MTRHNAGFMLLDFFADKMQIEFKASKKEYYYAEGELEGSPFLLVKPTTYVNLSGLAAKDVISEYGVSLEDFLVVIDDINLDLGKIRIRKTGGDGGHNGMNSIIYHLESEQFPRLRFGIGKEFSKGHMSGYVLDKFSPTEFEIIDPAFAVATALVKEFIVGGTKAMLDRLSNPSR